MEAYEIPHNRAIMTAEEYKFIDSARGRALKKLDSKELLKIWNKYSGEPFSSCMCSPTERREFSDKFFRWFDRNQFSMLDLYKQDHLGIEKYTPLDETE